MSEEISSESLKKSVEQVGPLYPRLVNQNGKVLDGNHRGEADKNWETKVIQTENRFKELLVRAHAHHRRRVPQEETRALVEEMAEALEKDGIARTDVAVKLVQSLPYSESYTRSLIPDIYKNPLKAQSGQKGGEKSATISEQKLQDASLHKVAPKPFDAADVVECERCHVNTTTPVQWHGHTLCSQCEVKANFNPEAYDGWFKYQERGKAGLIPKVKPVLPAADSWANREARMHPQKSKMEEELLVALSGEDLLKPIVTDRNYPIVSLTPDFVFPRHNLAVFIDGKAVHNHRQDRDKELRQKLSDRHGLKVLSITYDGNSEQEKQRIVAEIKGAV